MKNPGISTNVTDKSCTALDANNATTTLYEKTSLKQNLKNNWLSSAAILAFFIFVCLNALPFGMRFMTNPALQYDAADNQLNKLRQVVLQSPYEDDKSGPWAWWVARAYFKTVDPQIVVFGDSQMNAAFIQADAMAMNTHLDCTVDRSCIALRKELKRLDANADMGNIQAVNLALGGAMPSDYYLMCKAFFTPKHHPKLVIIGLSPRCFLDATLASASATETFQFLAPTVEMGNLVDSAFTNPLEKYFWILRNRFTLFAYQQDVLSAFNNIIDRYFGSKPVKAKQLAAEAALVPGRQPLPSIYSGNGFIALGTNMVGPNARIPFRENKAEYERRFAQLKTQMLVTQTAYMNATLQYLKSLGIKVIVVNMPMLQPVKDLLPQTFWNTYHQVLINACQDSNASFVDLINSKEFPQDEFIDYVHLNATGGKHFADKLAKLIVTRNILNSSGTKVDQ